MKLTIRQLQALIRETVQRSIKVTVPQHYDFILDDVVNDPENYDLAVQVSRLPDGNFSVTGDAGEVRAYVEELCIDDRESVVGIMKTRQKI